MWYILLLFRFKKLKYFQNNDRRTRSYGNNWFTCFLLKVMYGCILHSLSFWYKFCVVFPFETATEHLANSRGPLFEKHWLSASLCMTKSISLITENTFRVAGSWALRFEQLPNLTNVKSRTDWWMRMAATEIETQAAEVSNIWVFRNLFLPMAHATLTLAREGTPQNVTLRKGVQNNTWSQKMRNLYVNP
jgi:hypothetical protein